LLEAGLKEREQCAWKTCNIFFLFEALTQTLKGL
jgi:hypothetical protein